VDFLNRISSEEQRQQNLEKMDVSETIEKTAEIARPDAAGFPFEIVLTGMLILALILLIFWLRKKKPKREEEKEESPAEIERFTADAAPVPHASATVSYAMMDLDIVRKAFRDFERSAADADKGRKGYETVREWSKRMDWPVSESFYETYDFVRYGSGQISESKALPFLEEIKKIKEKYLKINV
jgi:hypothetical protein